MKVTDDVVMGQEKEKRCPSAHLNPIHSLTMATSLPFLNFPLLVSEQVLQNLELPDLFDLSKCSKRTFNVIKRRLRRPASMIIYIRNCVHLRVFCEGNSEETEWIFHQHREDYKTFYMVGKIPQKTDRNRVYTVRDVLKVAEYLLDLFNGFVSVINLRCDRRMILNDLLSIDVFRTIQTLRIAWGEVTHTELRKILSGFTLEEMSLVCTTAPNFSIDQPIKCNHFDASNGSWVTLEILQNLDCRIAVIRNNSFTDKFLNEYLKTWLAGSDTKLEYFKVTCNQTRFELAKIVEGIPNTPGVPKRPGAITTENRRLGICFPYENGVDLKRESDGMLATVVTFHEEGTNDGFLFVVWHVPDPNRVVVG